MNIESRQLASPMRSAIDATHVGYFEVGAMVQGLGWERYPYPVSLERLLDGNSQTMLMGANPVKRISPPRQASSSTLFNKTGSTAGFSSYVMFVPGKKIGLVMLANKNYPTSERVQTGHAILEQVAPMVR